MAYSPSKPICNSENLPPNRTREFSPLNSNVDTHSKAVYKPLGQKKSTPTTARYTYKQQQQVSASLNPDIENKPTETTTIIPENSTLNSTPAPKRYQSDMGTRLPPTRRQREKASYAHTRKQDSVNDSYDSIEAGGQEATATPPPKKNLALRILSDILFFGVLVGVVLGVLFYGQKPGQTRNILGYSFFTVLTSSMQSEIPKGSLVMVKETPADQLQIGDDITFMKDSETIVTHRIVDIVENYEESGARAFQTKGIENPLPDEDLVNAVNVIGKVTWHIPNLGFTGTILMANIKWVAILLGLLIVLTTSLRAVFSKPKAKRKQAPTHG